MQFQLKPQERGFVFVWELNKIILKKTMENKYQE